MKPCWAELGILKYQYTEVILKNKCVKSADFIEYIRIRSN